MTELHRFRQKSPKMFLELAFHDDYLEYLLPPEVSGTANRCKVEYEKLPPAFEYYDVTHRYEPGLAFTCSLISGFYFLFVYPWFLYFHISLHWIINLVMPLLAIIAISYFLYQRWGILPKLFVQRYTLVPLEQNRHLFVYRDQKHDNILKLLTEKRNQALRKYAEIDPLLDPLWQVKRLRWLHEQNVINFADLVGAEEKIRARFPELTFQPYAGRSSLSCDFNPEVTHQQKGSQGIFQFFFCKDHLRYCTEKQGFNTLYSDITSLKESEEISVAENFTLPFIFCVLCVCGCMSLVALYAVVNKHDPFFFNSYRGTLFAFYATMALALSGIATFFSFRLSDHGFVRIGARKGFIDILHDGSKAAILDEIAKRRLAALRQLAVIDDLNSREDEVRKFYALKREGIITESEYQAFSERIINTHFFGSDDAEKRDGAEKKNVVLN